MNSTVNDTPRLEHAQRHCPACGQTEREPLYEQRFAEFSTEGLLAGYDVVACRCCGMCFGDRIPNQDVFDRYYAVMSKYEVPRRPPDEHDPRWRRLHEVVPFIERAAQRDEAILEIGCASGQLLHLLEQRGYSTLRGVDPSPLCKQIAQECYGLHVENGTFSSIDASAMRADLVIVIGVLEHMRELDQALGVLRELVPAGGRVFVSVPDASRFAEGVDAPFQEFSVEHVNFFGPQSLKNLMWAHGFEPLFCESTTEHPNTTTVTPVIHATFVKGETAKRSLVSNVVPDTETPDALRGYVAKSEREHQVVTPVLHELAANGRPLVVWGAGAHTLRLLAQSPLSRANVVAIMDSNPRYQGKRVGAIPIVAPVERPNDDTAILVSSRVYQDEICTQIRTRLNWRNQVITLY